MVAQRVLLSAVAGLAAAASNDTITSDTYFYGLSPPVYPSREFFSSYLRAFEEIVCPFG